jgi:hypothetical protein
VSLTFRHIPFDQLVDLAEGRLSPAEQTRLQVHASTCSRCAPQLAWLVRVIGLMRTSDYEEPPPELLSRVVQTFDAYRPPAGSSVRERIRAVLQFDSTQMPLAPGRRSASTTDRQLLFTAGSTELELRIMQSNTLWEVSGQVLNADAQGLARLESTADEVQAELNRIGEFVLPPVPSGRYILILQLETTDLEIPGLVLGA